MGKPGVVEHVKPLENLTTEPTRGISLESKKGTLPRKTEIKLLPNQSKYDQDVVLTLGSTSLFPFDYSILS